MTTVILSFVTPRKVEPPLSPVNFAKHGGDCHVMFSCNRPPGAHLLLSPAAATWPPGPAAPGVLLLVPPPALTAPPGPATEPPPSTRPEPSPPPPAPAERPPLPAPPEPALSAVPDPCGSDI